MKADKMNKSKQKLGRLRALNREYAKMERLRKMFRKLKTLDNELNSNNFETVALQFANEFTNEWNENRSNIEEVLSELTFESLAEVYDKLRQVKRLVWKKEKERMQTELWQVFRKLEIDEEELDEITFLERASELYEKNVFYIQAEMINYEGPKVYEFMELKYEELRVTTDGFESLVNMTYGMEMRE